MDCVWSRRGFSRVGAQRQKVEQPLSIVLLRSLLLHLYGMRFEEAGVRIGQRQVQLQKQPLESTRDVIASTKVET